MIGRVDRYELLELIGQGSFGEVYRARHVHTGQLHALKLARANIDADSVARVLNEARAAAGLNHPNIVTVSDGGTTAEREAFMVMELLDGKTISQLVYQNGPLPYERAAGIARQILDGLGAAHAAGIVHRDIKPSNVFVMNGDRVKVIDFGISKIPSFGTHPGTTLGTPGYMAPEQLADSSRVDARADIYAVGATLFEMLTGRRALDADSFEAWMRKLRTENTPPIASVDPRIPPALAHVVDRALARDRDARWPSAQAMREALDHALPGTFSPTIVDPPRVVLQVTGPAPMPMAMPLRSSSPLPWVVAALAGVFMIGALGFFAFFVIGTRRPVETAAPTPLPPPTTEPPPTSLPVPTEEKKMPAQGGVQVMAPKIVGQLRQDAFMDLVDHAKPALEKCNYDKTKRTVRVDVHVAFEKITLAVPAVNEDHGELDVARCCANALKDAQWPGFRPGESGIYSSVKITWQ